MLRVKMVRVGTVKPRAMYVAENSANGELATIGRRACWGSEPGVREALELAGYREHASGEWSPAVLEDIVTVAEKYGYRSARSRGVTLRKVSLG